MVQLSATRCSCIVILWVSLVSFAAITLCIASQWVFIVVSVYFVIGSARKLLDTPSYVFVVWYLVKHRENFTFTQCKDMSWVLGSTVFNFRVSRFHKRHGIFLTSYVTTSISRTLLNVVNLTRDNINITDSDAKILGVHKEVKSYRKLICIRQSW
jgi:hypothetical protein